MAKASSPTKTCGEDGCGRPLRARGLCSTHYNRTRYTSAQRHPKFRATCVACGSSWQAARPDAKVCSDACRAIEYARRPCQMSAAQVVPNWNRRARARSALRRAARGTRGCRWVAGTCERCGEDFVCSLGADIGRYCSDVCKNRARNSRRRARVRGAVGERYSRALVFKRDRWRCHICKRMTKRTAVVPHPLAPVLDHLVPLACGGADTAANVATAHFLCNSTKREHGGGEQLMLIG